MNPNYIGTTPDAAKPATQQTTPYSAYIATPEIVGDQAWFMDSGTSRHVTKISTTCIKQQNTIVR